MMLSRSRPQGKAGVVQEKPAKDELRWQDFVERRDYTGVRRHHITNCRGAVPHCV